MKARENKHPTFCKARRFAATKQSLVAARREHALDDLVLGCTLARDAKEVCQIPDAEALLKNLVASDDGTCLARVPLGVFVTSGCEARVTQVVGHPVVTHKV